MTLLDAINIRHSRRKYDGTTMDPQKAAQIRDYIDQYNAQGDIRMELVLDTLQTFAGFTASYGMFSGVRDYVVLAGKKDDRAAIERLGYYGQLLILRATALGLNTCWVGGAFKKDRIPVALADDEELVCVIIIGNATGKESGMGKFIHKVSHLKNKDISQVYTTDRSDGSVPDWFTQGVAAAFKAPSSLNRKPVTFAYKGGKARASVKNPSDRLLALDLGIAKLHFEIGAACCQSCDRSVNQRWTWGNGGGYNNEG